MFLQLIEANSYEKKKKKETVMACESVENCTLPQEDGVHMSR